MKVIGTDNFCRDEVSDHLVAENLTEEEAKAKAAELNSKGGDYATYFYRTVPDDHKLYVWEP